MNKLAAITGFLGAAHNRYMVYQADRPLAAKLQLASCIPGCEGVEACYPSDFADVKELRRLLGEYGLGVAAVNFRSRRTGQWMRGSFTSERRQERQDVVDDLRRAMDCATELGCRRITTCPLNDGSDAPFETDFLRMYDFAAETLVAACAHRPDVTICIEYKKNDPRQRCFFGTVGEAASFCRYVGLTNLGVTLDIGHALYAEERPAQSLALLAKLKIPYYVHVNDNDGRWDWDMLPGTFHLWEFAEFFYALKKVGYDNDWYAFDVFPKEIDICQNFTAAFALTRKLEEITGRIDRATMEELMTERNPARTIQYLYSLL